MTLEQLIRRLRDLVLEDPKAAQYEVLNGAAQLEHAGDEYHRLIEEVDIQIEDEYVYIN